MRRKIKLLQVDFKSYVKFIFVAHLSVGLLLGCLFLIFGLLSLFTEIKIDGNLANLRFHGLTASGIGMVCSFLLLPIIGVIIAAISYWGFNFVLKYIKGLCIDLEIGENSDHQVIKVKKLGLRGLYKLFTLIAAPTGVFCGMLLFVANLLKMDVTVWKPNILLIYVSGPWWSGLFNIVTLPVSFIIDGLLIPVLLFLVLN